MDCDFCSVSTFNGLRYRRRPASDVLDELETISQKLIFFVDDNIIGYGKRSRETALELFKGMVDRGIDKHWFCQASINVADDEELLEWAGKAGCRMIFLGIEAEDIDALSDINKKLNIKRGGSDIYEQVFERIHNAGIAVLGAFIFGMDQDTPDTLRDRAQYILDSGVDVMQTTALTPLPGTRLFARLKEEGRLLFTNFPKDWDRYDLTEGRYRLRLSGYLDNIATGEKDINDGTSKGGKIALRWMINTEFTADFTFFYHDYSDNGRPEDADATPYLSRDYTSFDGYDDEMSIYNLTLNYDLGWGEIVSSTSYFDRTVINRRSLDLLFEVALPPGITPHELIDTTDLNVWSQEIRLASTTDAPLQWTVGMYMDSKDTYYLNTFPVPGADAVLGVPSEAFGAPADNLFWGYDDLTVKTYAFFGEAYYTFDKFTLTGGLRYFHWKQNIEFYQSGLFNGGSNSDPRPQSTEDGFNPKVTLAYDVNDEMMIYALASRGFRYGGINGAIPESVCADELEQVDREGGDVRFFDPDSLWNYEVGTKGTGAGGALSYSASYFLIKWNDMQTSRSFECGFGFRENVGKATSQGVELELHAAVNDRWVLGFGGAYIDSVLDEDVPNLDAEKGDQVPYVPKFSFSASSDYSFPMSDSVDGLFWANVQYIGTRHTEFNHDPNTNYREMDAYTVANTRFSVLWNDFDFSFYIHNIFDSGGVVRALRRPPFDPDAVIRTQPRTIGLLVRKYF